MLVKEIEDREESLNLNTGNIMALSSLVPYILISGIVIGAITLYIFLTKKKGIGASNKFESAAPGEECRLLLCIRHDLKMQKGKVAAECSHASVAAYEKGMKFAPNMMKRWMRFGGTKITLKVDTEEELVKLEKTAKSLNIMTSVVRDGGKSLFAPGSRTVLAIGPASQKLLENVTKHLKLY